MGRVAIAFACLVAAWFGAPVSGALADNLKEPPVFASQNGVLDLLMVARADRLPLEPFDVADWIYDVCPRPADGSLKCASHVPNPYGGVRLQLQQGDTLKIRLVNRLPKALNSRHKSEKGLAYLILNPTNLHTHGMLVSAHFPTLKDKTYGDNVFVLTLNPANGRPGPNQHIHGDVRFNYTDYSITIPDSHPSGLFWFHPHAHGLALNQISSGMAGIITVGRVSDYVCTTNCGLPAHIPVRHLILKDTQVLAPGVMFDQQDPAFCDPAPAKSDPPRLGECLQHGVSGDRGRWYFTVNGQQYPNVPVQAPLGQIWRITNASASVTYNLALHNNDGEADMVMQIVAIDGVSVDVLKDTSADVLKKVLGPALEPVPCPQGSALPSGKPLCVRRLVMFPSSRVEVWVTYRGPDGLPARPARDVHAVFRTLGINTGPGGDDWPSIDLATVVFRPDAANVRAAANLPVRGAARALIEPTAIARSLAAESGLFATTPDCHSLPPGHGRRIFFNAVFSQVITSRAKPAAIVPGGEVSTVFGLGYEEIDENGKAVPGTQVPISAFDPVKPTICLTLGPFNTPAYERWELVNLASEDHNFHMHQTKFALLTGDETERTTTPRRLLGHGVLHDNVPLQHSDGNCQTIDDWHQGKCKTHTVAVEIPFSVAGDYVYHCHILEHEDGGMMARIRVRAAVP